MQMMNSTNPQRPSFINSNLHYQNMTKNKFSISIFSNPLNLQVPFFNNPKPKLSSIYKITSDKIQKINPNQKKDEPKLTVSNLIRFVNTTSSNPNSQIHLSVNNKKPLYTSKNQKPFPAKTSNGNFHTKNFSISLEKKTTRIKNKNKEIFKELGDKVNKNKKNNKSNLIINIQSIQKIKQNSFNLTINPITSRNDNNQVKWPNYNHYKQISFSLRDIENKKQNAKREISVPNKKKENNNKSIPKKKYIVRKKNIIPIQQFSKREISSNQRIVNQQQKRPDGSSSGLITTEATPHGTVQKDCETTQITNAQGENSSINNSLFYLSDDEGECTDDFNDINSIVRKIDFDKEKDKCYDIFSINNKKYYAYDSGINIRYEQTLY